MRTGRGRALARAALAGNPSDGYGGATLAVVVPNFTARAWAGPAGEDRIVTPGPGGEPLLAGTLRRFRARFGVEDPLELGCETEVPREVGLGGSSAIVIAALRALGQACGRRLDPDELALLALAVEVEECRISAGLQDRIIQSRGGLVFMDFSDGVRAEDLAVGLLPDLYVAWRADAASPSGAIHTELRRRWERGDRAVLDGMAREAELARRARDALLTGDHAAFARCVDGSLDCRGRLMPIDPRLLGMASVARSHGASANSAGSGGAIVGSLPSPGAWPRLRDALRAEGCEVARVRRLEGGTGASA